MPERWITSSKGDLGACLVRMAQGVAIRDALLGQSSCDRVSAVRRLLDAVELFERQGIGYALVGSIAAMYYGRSRFTEDFEFVVASDRRFGWDSDHDSGVDIDIWKDEHAGGIVSRAREVMLAGRAVRVADPHDLIAMKLRAGRIQDDYDVSEILKSGAIDDGVVRGLVTPEQFEHYVGIKRRS